MRAKLGWALALTAATAGCSSVRESRYNPFNWWGGSAEQESLVLAPELIDNRSLMDQVTVLQVEKTPGGAIIRATGLPPTQGYFEGGLVPLDPDELPDKNGVLAYEFKAFPPLTPQPALTQKSREIVVGHFVSNQTLEGVRTITVRAQRNSRSARP